MAFHKQSLTPDTNGESDKENQPPPGVASKRKQKENDASTPKKKRPAEASTKLKKKREEVSVIARHPAPTLQVSLLSQLVQGQFSVS